MRKRKKDQSLKETKTIINGKTQRILVKTTIKNLNPTNRHQYINKYKPTMSEPHYQCETPKDLQKTINAYH